MKRFLVQQKLISGEIIRLSPEEARHALKALRLEQGASVLLTDGRGVEAEGELCNSDLEALDVKVTVVRKLERKVSLELVQAPLKGPKMDWLVEKLTEIGVSAVYLAKTKNTVAAGEKLDRWQRVAQSAVKQSGNAHLPSIHPVKELMEAIDGLEGLKILLQPGASLGLAEAIRRASGPNLKRVILAVGPEGGFSPEEEGNLIQAGFLPVSLSLQILRGETAAIAALAIAAHSIDF